MPEIKEAIASLLSDPEERERLGRAAREFVLEHYALDKIVEMELKLCKGLLTVFEA